MSSAQGVQQYCISFRMLPALEEDRPLAPKLLPKVSQQPLFFPYCSRCGLFVNFHLYCHCTLTITKGKVTCGIVCIPLVVQSVTHLVMLLYYSTSYRTHLEPDCFLHRVLAERVHGHLHVLQLDACRATEHKAMPASTHGGRIYSAAPR